MCPTRRTALLSSKEHSHSLGLTAPVDTNLRLRVFCDTYGLTARQRRAPPQIVEIRLRTLCAFIERSAAADDPGVGRVIEEGHLALYQRDIELMKRRRDELQ